MPQLQGIRGGLEASDMVQAEKAAITVFCMVQPYHMV